MFTYAYPHITITQTKIENISSTPGCSFVSPPSWSLSTPPLQRIHNPNIYLFGYVKGGGSPGKLGGGVAGNSPRNMILGGSRVVRQQEGAVSGERRGLVLR